MPDFIWVGFIIFLAAFITGLSGFGAVLVSLPLLALLMDIKMAIPLAVLATFFITLLLLIKFRSEVDLGKLGPILLGAIPGVPVGVWLLKSLDRSLIQLLLGFTLVIYPVFRVLSKQSDRVIGKEWAYIFGFIAGCLGGALGASGPPVIMYTSMQPWAKDRIKATLLSFFALETLAVLIVYAFSGLIDGNVIHYFGVSVPFILLGTLLGSIFYGTVNELAYRRLMLILMPLLGILMIHRALS